MAKLKIQIISFTDPATPGWVKCTFTDIHGNVETFVEKAPVISAQDLTEESEYPVSELLPCEILRKDGDIVTIDISIPWVIETESGKTVFQLSEDQILLYDDWKGFFSMKLVDSGLFYLSQPTSLSNPDTEIYCALKGNLNTKIIVGYFSSVTLIYIQIINPETPGKNKQQEIEHFYKYEFDANKQYGPPGLDFDDINQQGISNYLDQGFNGHETVYYRNGKPVKSVLTTSYYPDSPKNSFTYHFNNEPFYKTLLRKILKRNNKVDEIKHIDLREIFTGLSQQSK